MFTKDVKIGKYLIKNVPHVILDKPTGTKYARTLETQLNLARLFQYLERTEQTTFDYAEWEKPNVREKH